MQKEYLCAAFANIFHVCPFFTGNTDVNDGYGCRHPDQEEGEESNGMFHGACTHWSCPMTFPVAKETLIDPDVEWDGVTREDLEVEHGFDPEYVLLHVGPDTTEKEQELVKAYQHYMDRYQMIVRSLRNGSRNFR